MRRVFQNKSFRLIVLLALTLVAVVLSTPQSSKEKQVISQFFKSDSIKSIAQEKKVAEYIEIVESCGPYFESACVNVRSSPYVDAPVVTRLRNGVILKVADKITEGGELWYKVTFDEWLRYPERVSKEWYVSGRYVRPFFDEGVQELQEGVVSSSTKHIIVDRGDQMVYAYDGKDLFMKEKISTGIELTPTPRGVFTVYRKTPSRYMQGPIPGISEKQYDLPGVPWNLYFTKEGAVIHGAYWHDKFGKQWSSGCVNLSPEQAKKIYQWADVGTEVLVQD